MFPTFAFAVKIVEVKNSGYIACQKTYENLLCELKKVE